MYGSDFKTSSSRRVGCTCISTALISCSSCRSNRGLWHIITGRSSLQEPVSFCFMCLLIYLMYQSIPKPPNSKSNYTVCWQFRWSNAPPSSETQGQSVGLGERRDESFQVRAKEPLGTDPHRAISKNSRGCWLLIGHKKCFVLLCPVGEQFLLSSFREFVHNGHCFDHGLSGSAPNSDQRTARRQGAFSLI